MRWERRLRGSGGCHFDLSLPSGFRSTPSQDKTPSPAGLGVPDHFLTPFLSCLPHPIPETGTPGLAASPSHSADAGLEEGVWPGTGFNKFLGDLDSQGRMAVTQHGLGDPVRQPRKREIIQTDVKTQ